MRRFFAWVLALAFALMPLTGCAADDDQEIIGGILAYLSGGSNPQQWIDTTLAAGAGTGTDSLVPALMLLDHSYDFSRYIEAIDAKLASGIKSASTRQRSGLMLALLGEMERVPDGFADASIGELGVMSYVFGLHLLNNGFESENWTVDSLMLRLEYLQLEDGGWAVSGTYSDPDVTAMCIQALAACRSENALRMQLIDKALAYLSSAQNEDGSFSSYGNPACESCAQVIIALNSLGIDHQSDERFIKNGNTIRDAMLSFRLADGSFSHLRGGKSNTMACVQALCALVSQQSFGTPFYDFSSILPASLHAASPALPLWKLVAFGAIALIAVAGSVFSLTRRRAKGKRLLLVLLVCALASAAVWTINIETAESYYNSPDENRPVAGQVWLSIRCDAVAGRSNNGSTPESGEILGRTSVDFYEGDSVFDVLTHAARKYSIHMEHQGAGSDLAYVNGINYLYEYDYGDLSGWIYLVNGEKMSIGCGSYGVSSGDEIIWNYTLRLGEDLK